MGKRGPKPTPKAVLKLRGSWRAGKALDDKTPKARPARPQWITGEAHKEWKRIIPVLEKLGILAEIDRTIIASYCQYYAQWKDASEKLKYKNEVLVSDKGNEYQNPLITVADRAWDRMKKCLDAMGMSPAARTGIAVTPKNTESKDKSRFFDKKGG